MTAREGKVDVPNIVYTGTNFNTLWIPHNSNFNRAQQMCINSYIKNCSAIVAQYIVIPNIELHF